MYLCGLLAFDEHELAGVVPPRRLHAEHRLVVSQHSPLVTRSTRRTHLVVGAADPLRLATQREPTCFLRPLRLRQRLRTPHHAAGRPAVGDRSRVREPVLDQTISGSGRVT